MTNPLIEAAARHVEIKEREIYGQAEEIVEFLVSPAGIRFLLETYPTLVCRASREFICHESFVIRIENGEPIELIMIFGNLFKELKVKLRKEGDKLLGEVGVEVWDKSNKKQWEPFEDIERVVACLGRKNIADCYQKILDKLQEGINDDGQSCPR